MNNCYEVSIASGRLTYLLTENNSEYGIKVDCKLFDSIETFNVDNVTTNISMARDLLELLAENAVLPSNAGDVVADYVCDTYNVCC